MSINLHILKIGGAIIDDEKALSAFLLQFARTDIPKILVHGGGRMASNISKKMGLSPTMIDGRRITDDATLEVVTMVYGGLINKNIVAQLQSMGCNAAGICGVDGNSILARKRNHPSIDFGWAGDIVSFQPELVHTLLKAGFTPVVAPLTHDGKGQILNTNADTIAASLATGLCGSDQVTLLYCFEQKGLLRDIQRPEDVISKVKDNEVQGLIDAGVISGGMIPKVHNIQVSLRNGVQRVILCHAADMKKILDDPDCGTGTIFTL